MKNLFYLLLIVMVSACCNEEKLNNGSYYSGKLEIYSGNIDSKSNSGIVSIRNLIGKPIGFVLCNKNETNTIEYQEIIYFNLVKKGGFIYAKNISTTPQTSVVYSLDNIESTLGIFDLHSLYDHRRDQAHTVFHKFQKNNTLLCNNYYAGALIAQNGSPINDTTYYMSQQNESIYSINNTTDNYSFDLVTTSCVNSNGETIKEVENISITRPHPGH